MEPPSPWKRPNEVMQLHRLKKRKKALQERMKQPSCSSATEDSTNHQQHIDLDFSRILNGDKRKNPFSKNKPQETKKAKLENEKLELDESNDKTLFALLHLPSKPVERTEKNVESDKLSTFSNLLQKYTAEHSVEPVISGVKYKQLPMDWALKTKLRLMSPKPFPWSQQLKASEEASGITGFVRCLDTSASPTLDTSPRARFHQTCLYWQHPLLPWLSLFPRERSRAATTGFIAANEEAKAALLREWTESFRSLFQLVRARHCPYFYLCANTFTALFVAAGVGGRAEPAALLAPTTRGLRQTLRQEDVEFTMPLRPDAKRKLNNSDSKDDERPRNSSFDSCYDTMDESQSIDRRKEEPKREADVSGDEEELDSDRFLSQLGLETEVVKRINKSQARIQQSTESSVDSAAESLIHVRGADAQTLFNFLLNCKSLAAGSGALAAVPPTLLAPTAFHGGALQSLKVRESIVRDAGSKFYSIEVRGPILPTAVHSLLDVLKTSAGAQFSATCEHLRSTLAFTTAAKVLAEENSSASEPNQFASAFNKENLSDCGITEGMLRLLCAPDAHLQRPIDDVKYDCDDDTYVL